jgi:hypothetical protein
MSLKLNKFSVFNYNLFLSCLIMPCFATEEPDLGNKNPLYTTEKRAVSSASALTHFPVARPGIFSTKEWADIEIGHGIIKDRIKQKQDLLARLQDRNTSLTSKQLYCEHDFGMLHLDKGRSDLESNIKGRIKTYCDYISYLLDIYNGADSLTQLIINADSEIEKNKHQNNLYYFLSFENKHFKEYISASYTHQVPEHSLEDTFYEMISSKICATATK